MAVPKKKVSKARRDKRRSSTWKLETPALAKCPKCGTYNLPHRICANCGFYKGRRCQNIPIKEICKKSN